MTDAGTPRTSPPYHAPRTMHKPRTSTTHNVPRTTHHTPRTTRHTIHRYLAVTDGVDPSQQATGGDVRGRFESGQSFVFSTDRIRERLVSLVPPTVRAKELGGVRLGSSDKIVSAQGKTPAYAYMSDAVYVEVDKSVSITSWNHKRPPSGEWVSTTRKHSRSTISHGSPSPRTQQVHASLVQVHDEVVVVDLHVFNSRSRRYYPLYAVRPSNKVEVDAGLDATRCSWFYGMQVRTHPGDLSVDVLLDHPGVGEVYKNMPAHRVRPMLPIQVGCWIEVRTINLSRKKKGKGEKAPAKSKVAQEKAGPPSNKRRRTSTLSKDDREEM